MKAKIVKIGKSYGVILPPSFAKNLGQKSMVEITSTTKGISIDPIATTDYYDVNTEDDLFLFTDLSHELELEK
jgi:antitoxin component of MazEF toxin-antitoxin module